jgi:hypothetical protein
MIYYCRHTWVINDAGEKQRRRFVTVNMRLLRGLVSWWPFV